MINNGFDIDCPNICIIFMERLSWPWDLFGFSFLMCLVMSSSEKMTFLIDKGVTLFNVGSLLEVKGTMHCFLKYSLKSLHFSSASTIKQLSTKIGGILDTIFFLRIVFKVVQYYFWPVSGLASFLPRFLIYFSFSFSTI